MNQILSQDEVDALLKGISTGEVETKPSDEETKIQEEKIQRGQVRPYDFMRPETASG